MNEIEKMYKNAKVEKHLAYFECHRGRSSFRKCPICYDERDEGCFYCSCENKMKEVYEYPPFTAEKQLELIKWFAKNKFVVYNNLGGWHVGTAQTYSEELGIVCNYNATNIDLFEGALAGLINKLWQSLTEEEKQQVKGILK